MSCGYSNRVWKCPFFQYDRREEIHCEGGIASFLSQGELAAYANKYCSDARGWEKCHRARRCMDEREENGMERNIDKIKRLEREIGRWKKKVRDQGKELEKAKAFEAKYAAGIQETNRLVDGILAQVAVTMGERAKDPDTGEAIGWRLTLPGMDIAKATEKYEVRARRDEKGGYTIGVTERESS